MSLTHARSFSGPLRQTPNEIGDEKMKKLSVLFSVLLILSFVLSACAPKATPTQEAATEEAPPAEVTDRAGCDRSGRHRKGCDRSSDDRSRSPPKRRP